MYHIALPLLVLTGLLLAVVLAWRWMWLQSKARERWYQTTQPNSTTVGRLAAAGEVDRIGGLGRWLYRAGFRGGAAPQWFLLATGFCIGLGLAIALAFTFSGLQQFMEQTVVLVPGGVGETFLPVVWVAPWLICVIIGSGPWLFVRRSRRQRVELVEQDLPLALELLSTLSEAGLGFDAALTRILKTRLSGRPLATEFQMFQADLLAGRARVESLRRLSTRIDLPSVSVFVSALVQAEQLGMGIARVLRQQADDVRARRRERAIAFANALPTKRVIPLVVCFLPGLFVWTLGPAFVQLFKMAETFIQVRNF